MNFNRDIQNSPSDVPNNYFAVDSIVFEPHNVLNQNIDSTTDIYNLQYQDISATNTQLELQPAVQTYFFDNNPPSQLNNEIWDDSQQQQTDIYILQNTELSPTYGGNYCLLNYEFLPSDVATSNTQYPTVTTTTDHNITNISNYTTLAEETYPVFTILKQPKKLYRFRFEREIEKESHGYLLGRDSAGRNLKTFITVELRMPPHAQDAKYFLRCTLHQPLKNGPEESFFISPHTLCRRENNASFTREDKLFPMVEVTPQSNCYQFKLENFLISRPVQKKYHTNCQDKYKLLHGKYDSRLRLAMPTDKDTIEQTQVQIGFEAFKLMQNGSYSHVIGPIFSDCITNGESLKITRICNLSGCINGGDEVTLLVTGYNSKMNISIEIDDTLGWYKSIEVKKPMLHSQAAITFITPKYDSDHNQDKQRIRCEIRLKREIDGEISDVQYFTYNRSLKRSSDEISHSDETQRKVKKPEPLSPQKPQLNFGNKNEYETDSVNVLTRDNCKVIQGKEPSPSAEPMNSPTVLVETLQEIGFLYKKAENVCSEEKLMYSKLVRENFDYYRQESPYENSILHDVLESDHHHHHQYEMKLYKIIQHFELKDLIRNSKNIYGETPLMFACIFNKPQLIRALINMECPIEAREYEDGNNVLHLISQHQSTVECRRNVLEAIKASQNEVVSAGFIKAMKDTNLNGLTPLHIAVMYDNVKLVNELLRLCKRHNALNDVITCGKLSDGNTILHQAVLSKSEEMYSRILKYAPDTEILNVENFAGLTAAEMKQTMEINNLVDFVADINLLNQKE